MATRESGARAKADPPAEPTAQEHGTSDWPAPGEEGFVHNDGTEQSRTQLAANRRAAAAREAAGSGVDGAPANGGVQPTIIR